MPEEIRIIADLDTTLFDDGVGRIQTAVPKIKAVIEDATKVDPAKADDAGAKIASSFSTGFIRKLVIRDAIYSVIAGIGEALKGAEASLNKLTGVDINISIWKSLGDIMVGIAESIKGVNDSVVQHAESNIREITADERNRQDLARFKNDPHQLNLSRADAEANLEKIIAQQAADKINNQQFNINKAAAIQAANPDGIGGDAVHIFRAGRLGNADSSTFAKPGADIDDAELKRRQARSGTDISHATELVSIAKERDRLDAEAKNKEAAGNAAFLKAVADGEKKEVENAAKATRDSEMQARAAEEGEKRQAEMRNAASASEERFQREQARIKKKQQRHDNAQTISEDEVSEHGASKDLDFTRGQLDHQRATSAVRIGGGLFGKNDSAATLVQHAATQINLLRIIAAELKQTRENQSELTLQ